jgi:retron-type reverse transcriptase
MARANNRGLMPKTHNNIWDKIVDFENIHTSYLQARKLKRYKPEVLKFSEDLEGNLIDIQNKLIWKTWEPSRWNEFYVYDPKTRLIQAPPFKDRVVHHALVNIIEPLFEKRFIYDSYACRRGKGTHAAMHRVLTFARRAKQRHGQYYVLKGDISNYFHSINHEVLMGIVRRTIRDRDTLWLIDRIVNCDDNDTGLPIGALTSQLFANIYMDVFDHFMTDDLGLTYCRYMDDFIVIHQDKRPLSDIMERCEGFLWDKLRLKLNPKTKIFKGEAHPIDFCGYRIWTTHIKPRKRTLMATRRRFRKYSELYRAGRMDLEHICAGVMSFLGYIKHCNGYRSTRSVLKALVLTKGGVNG